jgi:hypothetical protein
MFSDCMRRKTNGDYVLAAAIEAYPKSTNVYWIIIVEKIILTKLTKSTNEFYNVVHNFQSRHLVP